jgi:hypothetical protein
LNTSKPTPTELLLQELSWKKPIGQGLEDMIIDTVARLLKQRSERYPELHAAPAKIRGVLNSAEAREEELLPLANRTSSYIAAGRKSYKARIKRYQAYCLERWPDAPDKFFLEMEEGGDALVLRRAWDVYEEPALELLDFTPYEISVLEHCALVMDLLEAARLVRNSDPKRALDLESQANEVAARIYFENAAISDRKLVESRRSLHAATIRTAKGGYASAEQKRIVEKEAVRVYLAHRDRPHSKRLSPEQIARKIAPHIVAFAEAKALKFPESSAMNTGMNK